MDKNILDGVKIDVAWDIVEKFSTMPRWKPSDVNDSSETLIKKFKDITNCPVLINTSFNVRGEPIVNTPSDAFNCFMGTEMDKLVIGNCFLDKKKQNKNLEKDYKNQFELD